jgi:anti-sigma factor (TIGR02949 family)
MDCQEVMEILDAYALGAAGWAEAERLEAHAADCIECWEELTKAQRTAALLALAVPLQQAPERLRKRLMAAVEEDVRASRPSRLSGLLRRWRLDWRPAAVAAGGLGIAALALSGFLLFQVQGLRDDKSQLEDRARQADARIAEQDQIVAVLSAADAERVSMEPVSGGTGSAVVYNWSRELRKGFLVCQGLDALEPGQMYQVWFTEHSESYRSVAFAPEDGSCHVAMDISFLKTRPDGIGLSVEDQAGSPQPAGWLMYASFRQ